MSRAVTLPIGKSFHVKHAGQKWSRAWRGIVQILLIRHSAYTGGRSLRRQDGLDARCQQVPDGCQPNRAGAAARHPVDPSGRSDGQREDRWSRQPRASGRRPMLPVGRVNMRNRIRPGPRRFGRKGGVPHRRKGASDGRIRPGNGTLPGRGGELPGRGGELPGRSAELPGRSAELPGRSAEVRARSGEVRQRHCTTRRHIGPTKRHLARAFRTPEIGPPPLPPVTPVLQDRYVTSRLQFRRTARTGGMPRPSRFPSPGHPMRQPVL